MYREPRGPSGADFAKGAGGCLGLFLLIGVIVAAAGGTVYLNGGGLILLLLIGGCLGLAFSSFYWKGRRDAGSGGSRSTAGSTVDDLVAAAEKDLREGRINKAEFDRRVQDAWGGR